MSDSSIWTPPKPIANVNDVSPPKSLERARLMINDPDVAFVTVIKSSSVGAIGDVLLNFPKPCNSIMVVACTPAHISDSLYLHFLPLGKTYIGLGITPIGNEPWLTFNSQSTSSIGKIGIGYRFTQPMPINSFLDIGDEAGAGTVFITFAVGNDFKFWNRV
jgi:hypothetical protein